jgi:rhodanese-related sulfurtransferase
LVPRLLAENVVAHVTPSLAMAKLGEGNAVFVDARPTILYEQMHIEGAINIPSALFDIMYMVAFNKINKKKHIIVYGRTISSHYDEQVAKKLILRGYDSTMILKGGLSAWEKKGYPVR